MILLMLAGVMFPLWPSSMRVGVWYLSIGLLGLIGAFFGLAIVRLIIWCVTTVTMSPAIWIFPNLFEDVGFVSGVLQGRACELLTVPHRSTPLFRSGVMMFHRQRRRGPRKSRR